MDGDGSFQVHLASLTDFARHLREHADAVSRCADALAGVPRNLPLGAFAEAYALSDGHEDVATRMGQVLDRTRQALEFAERVTAYVAGRYETLSRTGAERIQAIHNGQ